MGLPYRRHAGKEIAAETLAARRENWKEGHIPDGVALLTAGVDTQDDRIEVEVVGWGRDEESWSIAYEIIPGAFDNPTTKAKLDEYLLKVFTRTDGREVTPSPRATTRASYRSTGERPTRLRTWSVSAPLASARSPGPKRNTFGPTVCAA